ncbi:hypothetical protein [Clostridium sp. D33t1_170424_F3]|uniref:hypothetical protein n=1 Tax=Clostridium sp. D33t1_170424_F3 TaxID=2787099 RepID=UPI0018AC1374|nr:hypothetical protein [Clostridium sp. D33t1_170424_F3]
MSNKSSTEAAGASEIKAAAAPTPPKFTIARLRKECYKLFGVTVSTFDGATHGLAGTFSVAEMRSNIEKWQNKAISSTKTDKKEVNK